MRKILKLSGFAVVGLVAAACEGPEGAVPLAPVSFQVVTTPGTGSAIVSQNTADGRPHMRAFNGNGFASNTRIDTPDLPAWTLLGSGDFDKDGYGDLLWVNKYDRAVTVWLMQAGFVKAQPPTNLGTAPVLSDGTIARALIADLDRDGKSEIVWVRDRVKDANNFWTDKWSYTTWTIGDLYSSSPKTSTTAQGTGKIEAIGNFGGGPKLDFVTMRPTSTGSSIPRYRLDNGVSVDGPAVVSAWKVVGAGEFNGGTVSELLWHRSDLGEVSYWTATDGTHIVSKQLGTAPGSGWSVKAIGDIDRNGVSDIVWHSASEGKLRVWYHTPTYRMSYEEVASAAGEQIVGVMEVPERLGQLEAFAEYTVPAGFSCPFLFTFKSRATGLSHTGGTVTATTDPNFQYTSCKLTEKVGAVVGSYDVTFLSTTRTDSVVADTYSRVYF